MRSSASRLLRAFRRRKPRTSAPARRRPFVVGIGGQAGTGKSLVARSLAGYGAELIDADRIGWELLTPNTPTGARVVRAFGRDILNEQGEIDRRRLGTLVFADRKAVARLNRIVHPALLAELDRRVRSRAGMPFADRRAPCVKVVDAALLFFWGWHKRVDLAVLVTARLDAKLARLQKKGIPRSRGIQRLRSQLRDVRMRRMADVVIRNDGTIADLNRQCRDLWQNIVAQAAGQKV